MNDFRKKPTENIPSARRKIIADRDMGYTFHSAVGDIIDNSISHGKANNISIIVNYASDCGVESFLIIDDGEGFPVSKEDNVMRYGSDEAENEENLGKFGVGLKSASTSMCRKLSVISKHRQDKDPHKAVWDLDHVVAKDKWEVLYPHINHEEKSLIESYFLAHGTGTIVKWENVDRIMKKYSKEGYQLKALDKILNNLKFYLGMTFQRFLDRDLYKNVKNINITIKCEGPLGLNEQIEPWDPFCRWSQNTVRPNGEAKQMTLDFEYAGEDKGLHELIVDSYIVPYRAEQTPEDIKKGKLGDVTFSGMYVYRNNRLIQHGNWLGMMQNEPHTAQARCILDFNEKSDDLMQIDIKKTRITLYPIIQSEIKKKVSTAVTESRNYKRNKNKEKKKGIHDNSNKIIKNKKNILSSKFKTKHLEKDKVQVKNKEGKVVLSHPTLESDLRIEIGEVKYGALWEPFHNSNDEVGVRFNPDHPFYQKIYMMKDESGGVFVEGLDFIFISLISAELEEVNEDRVKVFSDMRFSVSRNLEGLVADMDEPNI